MKPEAGLAVAIGVGYLLGRRHKLRLASILAIAAATGGLRGASGQLFKGGSRMLGASPELTKLARLGGPLATAGKAAAAAAVATRMRLISDRLNEQTEALRTAGRGAAEETTQEETGPKAGRGRPERVQESAELEAEGPEPEGREAEAARPRRAARRQPSTEAPVRRRAR